MKNSKEVRCLMQQIAFIKISKDDFLDLLMELSCSEPYQLSKLFIIDLIQSVEKMTDHEFESFLNQTLSL